VQLLAGHLLLHSEQQQWSAVSGALVVPTNRSNLPPPSPPMAKQEGT